ncbi:MAG: hypothetical protein ABGZ35_18960, partial [Planctomycetaceae bacterium]
TDGKFVACIKSASQNGTQWFTENQLYAVFCRRMSRPQYKYALVGLAPMGIALGIIMVGDHTTLPYVLPLIAGTLVLTSVLAIACYFLRPTVERSRFDSHLKLWKNRKGSKDFKLLTKPALKKPPPEWTEPDIYDYGVERILIVERDILVDLFVRNGFHAEQRMLVLSESGYPSYMAPVARKLMDERADLPVFLLHDATAHGVGMEQRIRSGDLLPLRDHPLTDLGLFPADFEKLKRTNAYDVANKERALPADALMFPFLIMGMGSAFTHGDTFSTLLAQDTAYSSGGSSGSGGCGGGGDGDFG